MDSQILLVLFIPVKLKNRVAEIVEINTPMKVFFCYKVVQKPVKVSRNYLKELWEGSKYTWNQFTPEIVLYYSIDKPHRLIYYEGYSDVGPASPNRKEVNVISQKHSRIQLVGIEPLPAIDGVNKAVLFEKLEEYHTF